MKFQPVIKHEPPHEGINREGYPPKEVRCEHHTLTGLGSGNSLPLSRQRMRDFAGQIPGIPSFRTSSSVTEEGIHRPWRSELDIIKGPKRLDLEPWVLELKARGRLDWIEKEEVSLGLFIKRLNTKSPPRDRLELTFD